MEYDLQGAFIQLITLVREVNELQVCEILLVLHKSCLMLHQLEYFKDIEPNYFKRNLSGECGIANKYKELIDKEQKISMTE